MLQQGEYQLILQLQRNGADEANTALSQENLREEWRDGRFFVLGPDLDEHTLKLVINHKPAEARATDGGASLPTEVEIFVGGQKNASNPLLWPAAHLAMDGLSFAAVEQPTFAGEGRGAKEMKIEVRFYRVIALHEVQVEIEGGEGHQTLFQTERMVEPDVVMELTYCGGADTGSTSEPSNSQSQLTPSPVFSSSSLSSNSSYPSSQTSQASSLSSMTPPTPFTIPPSAYDHRSSSAAPDFSLGSLPDFSCSPYPSSTPAASAPDHFAPSMDIEEAAAAAASIEAGRKRKRPDMGDSASPPLATSPNASQVERKRRLPGGESAFVAFGSGSVSPQEDSPLLSLVSTPLLIFLLSAYLDYPLGYLDLLSLSRSCKRLHHLLLSSPAAPLVWSAVHSFDFSPVGKHATKVHIADILFRCRGYQEDGNAQTRELLRSSPLLLGLEQRGRIRSLNLSHCALLSLVDIKRLVEMCAPPPPPPKSVEEAGVDGGDQFHTPPKQEDEEAAIAGQHLETLRLMELDTIRNLAFVHGLYYRSAPYLRVLEVKNCSGLDSSRGVPFFDAAAASPYPTPAPSPLPWGRTGGGGMRGTPQSVQRGGRGGGGGGGRGGAASTPTFVVTPSRHNDAKGGAGGRGQGGGQWRGQPSSSSSRSLFSSPSSSGVRQPPSALLSPARPGASRQFPSSAPTSPYATPPRHHHPHSNPTSPQQAGLLSPPRRSGYANSASAPASPHRSPPSGPGSPDPYSLLALLPPSLHLREVSLLKCAPPEQCIIQLVTALPNLESLDLWGCKVTDKVVEVLSIHCPRLQKLSLAENPITDRSLGLISPASFPDLTSLTLRRCTELTSTGIATMALTWHQQGSSGSKVGGEDDDEDDDYFKQQQGEHATALDADRWPVQPALIVDPARPAHHRLGLESLDLWGVNLYDHGLMAVVSSFPHLKTLWLGETSVTDEGLHSLARGCTELQEISLRRCSNGVTDAGIIPLLLTNTSLSKIDLWGVRRVTDAPVEVIAQRFASTLKSLELAESGITDASLINLASYGCRLLEELSLRRCLNITDAGLVALAQGCPAIKTLDLWECGLVTDVGLEAIATHLSDLHSLEVTETPITGRSLVALAGRCNHLTHLALRRCDAIDDEALAAFFAALPADLRRRRLRTLDLSYCPRLTPATLDMLASSPAHLPHTIELYDCPQIGKQHIEHFLATVPANRTQVQFHDYKRMSIKELKALCDSFECWSTCPTAYTSILCTVHEIRASSMWYHGCPWPKCHKKVEEYHSAESVYEEEAGGQQQQQKRWFCKSCNQVYSNYVNRYMVGMRIIDHTGDVWLRAFDEAATPLIGISAQELSQLRDFDEALFEDKVKEAQLQRHELRVKVVQETYQGRRSGRPYLLSHVPIASAASSEAAALAKRIETYLWIDCLPFF